MKPSVVFLWVVLLVCLGGQVALRAQETQQTTTISRGAQYYLGREDELLIPVNIWGFVHKPGQFMVPNNIDLVTLLSFAGGPTEDGKISNVKIVRSDPKMGRRVIKVNIKKYLNTADQNLIPLLKPGDTVIVKGTTFHWFTRLFEFVSRMAVVAQIFYFVALAHEYWTRN